MFRRILALAAAAAIAGAFHVRPAARAQESRPSPADTAARIDSLIKDADDDLAKGAFDAMTTASESAVALSRTSGDRPRLAQALFRLGQGRFYQSRNAEALAAQREVVDIATALGDRPLRARGLNGIGLALRELGEYDQAIEFLSQALAAHRASGNKSEQVRVQRNIAVLYWQLGDLKRAETTIRAASALASAVGDKIFETVTLQAYGAMVLEEGRPREALAIEQRALAIASSLNVPALLIDLGVSIGDAAAALGDHERAIRSFKTTLDASERAGYAIGEAVATSHIGAVDREVGRYDEALSSLLHARSLFAMLRDNPHIANVLANEFLIGRTLRDQGRLDEALSTYRAAIGMLDRMRTGAVPIETATASVNAARSELFLDTAALLARLGRDGEAFDIAERYHARAFLDTLAAARVDVQQALSPAERARQGELLARASALQRELWSADLPAARRQRVDAELSSVDDEFERLAGGIRRRSPGYAVHVPEVLDAAAVQHRVIGDGTVLVEYLLGDRTSFAWVISRGGIRTASLPSRKTLQPLIARYRTLVSTRASTLTIDRALREVDRASADLYAAIVAPIQDALDGAERVIVVADGPLAYIPFEPLKPRGRAAMALVDRFDVSYAPSASALAAIAAMQGAATPTRDLLAIGNPATTAGVPLPFTRDEVNAIGALFPPGERTVYLGAAAREDRVKATPLADYRYVHFATHGLLDSANPSRSGLLLARDPQSRDDGVLQTREIMQLKLNADMVTLSACDTGLGRLVRSEGVMGIARAFFYAGARSVVVSLWDVNDGATAALMREFYGGVRRGRGGAAALGAAKRSLLHGPVRLRRHPYFWAPFVFTGPSPGISGSIGEPQQ